MFNKKLSNSKGFTIIEVLIVLAIAGLIMVIVFLAVPSLQRNSRNTQRRTDVANLLAAVGEHSSNTNGALPNTATEVTNNAKLSIYTTANISLTTYTSGNNTTTVDQVVLSKGAKCNGGDPVAGNSRSIVALYSVEGGTAPAKQCQES